MLKADASHVWTQPSAKRPHAEVRNAPATLCADQRGPCFKPLYAPRQPQQTLLAVYPLQKRYVRCSASSRAASTGGRIVAPQHRASARSEEGSSPKVPSATAACTIAATFCPTRWFAASLKTYALMAWQNGERIRCQLSLNLQRRDASSSLACARSHRIHGCPERNFESMRCSKTYTF